MGNCLVTKLNGIVDNDNLEVYGVIRVKVPAGFNVNNVVCPFGCSNNGGKFQFTSGITVVSAESPYTDYTSLGEAPCSYYEDSAHVVYKRYNISSENGGWLVFEKYDNNFTYLNTTGLVNPSPSQWIFMPNIVSVYLDRTNLEDVITDLAYIKKAVGLLNLSISGNCVGNIQDLGPLTSLVTLNLPNSTILPLGTVEDFLNAQVANGRTSGSVDMWIGKIPYKGISANRNVIVDFSPSYESGWQERQ